MTLTTRLALLIVGTGITSAAVRGAAPDTEDVAKRFQARCINCHQPPDLTLATDRAWLERLHNTA